MTFVWIEKSELEKYGKKIEKHQKKQLKQTCKKMKIEISQNASIDEIELKIRIKSSNNTTIKVPWKKTPWAQGE